MTTISLEELGKRAAELLERDEPVFVMRDGEEAAVLYPIRDPNDIPLEVRVDNDASGRKYQDTVKIGFDPDTNMLLFVERRSDGFELASLGNWRSPIGISFVTQPVKADGKTFQLRRFIAVRSEAAFDVTEEISVDGGAFKRLGTAGYTKQP